MFRRPAFFLSVPQVAEVLGRSVRSVLGLIYCGPLVATCMNSVLVVHENHLAEFVASRRAL